MPGNDGTGPLGGGPRTGGGFGNCTGQGQLGQDGSGGKGRSAGRQGRGVNCRGSRYGTRGWGQNPGVLPAQAPEGSLFAELRSELDQVKQRLAEVLGRLKGQKD
jgi:hypothetical protein